ncbi:MAG TPA: DNA polymerase III subunit alpha [Candidatus Acidoferrales bacterium]|jgi:DNA polymerase-3 subunit alpha|nr:DNA polymerase III subunit alpha [Candidatus Acidoferrales bacterium]
MGSSDFVHLHLHTDYSLLDGACEIGELTAEAARRKMPAVAVTDHGNLFAAANFFHQATTHGVKPIIGCEVYVAPDNHKNKGADAERSNHLVLLCENDEGYRNLIQLVSTGFLDGFYYKPRIDHELLAKHSRGLIALSACLRGEVTEHVLEERHDQARTSAYRLQEIFGKQNFFLEIQDQGLDVDKRVNQGVVRLAKETGIPLVATNDCHYLTRSDAHAQEVLLCIQTGKTMSDTNRMRFATDQFYFKTAEEMSQVFGELPDALLRTVAIAERCQVKIERVQNPFPVFQVPEGTTTDSYFERVAREGFAARLPQLERLAKENRLRYPLTVYEQRLSDEIEMIKKMLFSGYFLIVWDFIRYARAQGVPVGPGRGSAAGSLVSYALRITDVDPLEYDLLFERFLNPERISMPDIDIDFCMRRRGEVIEYVRQKYGEKSVAQIITFGTMAAKAALKDVGRALDMPYGEVDRLAKLIPNQLNISLEDALKDGSPLALARDKDDRVREVVEVALRLEGLARHASTHAAGVVISPRPLTEIVPLYRSTRDEITTQYDMNALERIGLLKMDFLGLTTLTVLDDAVLLIKQNRGVDIKLADFPLDDAPTYAIFARADTSGIFQFESHGMREILRRYQPTRLEDLTALNALYRPGPIQGGMIDDFIARKHGKKKVAYDLPALEEILSETYGVILYQEQVMQIANRLAGFSLGEADILRRAMGKKKREEMAAQREKFLTGCAARKVPAKKAEKIFDLMAEFAGYGFNKSHSCAYALLAYQTAYLKTHFPVEFTAALLTSEIGNTEKVVKYINEVRGSGIRVLPPDVHQSSLYFTPVGEDIRFGLAAIKNVGENTAKAICESRAARGNFQNIYGFCSAIEPRFLNRRVLESLVKAGAMDCFDAPRARLWAAIEGAMNHGQKMDHQRSVGQHGLFLSGASSMSTDDAQNILPEADDWSEDDQLAGEHSVLGFYVSGHPLDKYAGRLTEMGTIELGVLESRRNGEELAIAGIITQTRAMRSKRGARWAIFNLQDRTGGVEVLVFPEAFQKFEHLLRPATPLLVRGRINVEEVGTRFVATEIRLLDKVADRSPSLLRVRVDLRAVDTGTLDQLQKVLAERPGRCRVAFDLISDDGTMATLEAEKGIEPAPELFARVREICGADSVAVSRN